MQAVGPAGVEHHRVQHAVATARRDQMTGAATNAVRGEDRGRIEPRTLFDDQRQIGLAVDLMPAAIPAAANPGLR